MADDAADETDTVPRRRAYVPKGESRLGNILEAALTYGAGALIYLPVNAFLIFGPFEFNTPEAQAIFWPAWLFFSYLYDFGQRVAANEGIKAKFAGKTMRLFADFVSSALPLCIPALMILLSVLGVYHATKMDCFIAIFLSFVCINDLYGNSNTVHTALRRVREVSTDT